MKHAGINRGQVEQAASQQTAARGEAPSTQHQIYETVRLNIANRDRAIMDMIHDPRNPMTNADLAALVERRPSIYGRYRGLIGKLEH